MEEHLDPETLRRFWRRRLPKDALLRMLEHLEVCQGDCAWRLEVHQFDTTPLWPDGAGKPKAEPATELSEEGSDAEDLYQALMRVEPARRSLVVRNHSRYQHPSLCRRLIEESHEARFQDPRRMVELAWLAVALAGTLKPGHLGEQWLADLRAQAEAHLGNALRVNNELQAAEDAFDRAEGWLSQGTRGPLLVAKVRDLQASLRNHQRRFEAAVALADQAYELYVTAGQYHLAGRTLIKKGEFLRDQGRPILAVVSFVEGLKMIEAESEPDLLWGAVHNLAVVFLDLGDLDGACRLATQAGKLCEALGKRRQRLVQRWLQARVATAKGDWFEACSTLMELREEYLELGIGIDAALAALDLARIYARQGRLGEVRRLAAEMLPVFRKQDVHREARIALGFFCQAARQELVTLAVVEHVARFLTRARRDPGVRFEPPRPG